MPVMSRTSLVAPDHTLTTRRFTGYAISLEARAMAVERRVAYMGLLSDAPLRRADLLRRQAASWRHAASVVRTLHTHASAEVEDPWTAPAARVARG